jgi:hypothetical protein
VAATSGGAAIERSMRDECKKRFNRQRPVSWPFRAEDAKNITV